MKPFYLLNFCIFAHWSVLTSRYFLAWLLNFNLFFIKNVNVWIDQWYLFIFIDDVFQMFALTIEPFKAFIELCGCHFLLFINFRCLETTEWRWCCHFFFVFTFCRHIHYDQLELCWSRSYNNCDVQCHSHRFPHRRHWLVHWRT